MEQNCGAYVFFSVKKKKREKELTRVITRGNVFLSVICIIEVFEMMAILAIDGLDSTK